MTYSTGSGTYVDMMAAVLTHAQTDLWTDTAGNWPISKGIVRGVDYTTFTTSENDRTNGGSVAITPRYGRICVGTSGADATSRIGSGEGAVFANLHYAIDAWHIFSDPATGDWIHCVYQFATLFDPVCFGHFSFGEVYTGGMAHSGVVYATGSPARAFAIDSNSLNFSRDWNGGVHGAVRKPFTGELGHNSTQYPNYNSLVYMPDPTTVVAPVGIVWPQANTLYNADRALDSYAAGNYTVAINSPFTTGGLPLAPMGAFSYFQDQLYSGGVTLGGLPLLITNSSTENTSLRFIMAGDFPQVRICGVFNHNAGDEVTFGGETWKIFPLLKKTTTAVLGSSYTVTSGNAGLAYKKVP